MKGPLFIPAFVPDGKSHPSTMPARMAALVAHARSEGMNVVGFRLCLAPIRGTSENPDLRPMSIRARRTLKHALRKLGFRCVDIKGSLESGAEPSNEENHVEQNAAIAPAATDRDGVKSRRRQSQ